MTRAETLAGLAEEIAGHQSWMAGSGSSNCDCGAHLGGQLYLAKIEEAHAAHVAAVALAWLEGHGWAEGAEEWGVRFPALGTIARPSRELAEQEVARQPDARHLVRRYTFDASAWAPVETGDQK